jgi:serine protease Do
MSAMNTALRLGSIALLGSMSAMPMFAAGDMGQFYSPLQDSPAYFSHQSQGYLGVTIRDVDSTEANSLKLKDAKGAVIVMVDQDAPACKAGMKPNDVILEMNGQPIEGVEQLRRMLRETPIGKNVDFVISRKGVVSTISVQLADKDTLGKTTWDKHQPVPEPPPSLGLVGNMGLLGEGGGGGLGGMFTGKVSTLHIGVSLNPVTTELATHMGARSGATGLLVEKVEKGSPAAEAGLKVGDLVLKVNQDAVVTRADWERVMRENADKTVQITLVREKREVSVTMKPSTQKGKDKSDLEWQREFPSQAELDSFAAGANDLIAQFDSKAFDDQFKAFDGVDAEKLQREFEQAAKQMEKGLPSKAELDAMISDAQRMQKSFDAQKFQNEFAKSFQGFEGQELQNQVNEWNKKMPDAFSPEKMKEFQQQMQQFQNQFETQTMD